MKPQFDGSYAGHEETADRFVAEHPELDLDGLLGLYEGEDRAAARGYLIDAIHRQRGSR